MKSKKSGNHIKAVAAKADTMSPLKPMRMNPIEEPKGHKPGEGGGTKTHTDSPHAAAKAKAKKAKTDGQRRPRNKGR